MRLLLDAHVSGPRVGRRLEADGHDVRALDQELALEGLDDEEVLALATDEQRILVTHNVRDFPVILRDWAAAQRSHVGVVLCQRPSLGSGERPSSADRWGAWRIHSPRIAIVSTSTRAYEAPGYSSSAISLATRR